MPNVTRSAIRRRLAWVESARLGLISALGDDVMHSRVRVTPTVDPLKLILSVALKIPLAKGTRPHLRTYLRCHAEMHGCELPIIRITDKRVQAEVLIESRYKPRDHLGRFKKRGRRFERKNLPENEQADK